MLVCGVDIGTTNLKVSIVDETGVSRWTRSVPTPRSSPSAGIDAAVLVGKIEDLVVEGWHFEGSGLPLSAIATTGVGEDGVCVDQALRPLDVAIPWYDRCAVPEAIDIRESSAATTRAGIEMEHTRTGAKWLWLHRNRPTVVRASTAWITVTDYPSAYWTGRPFISETLASRTGCYDVGRRQWIEPLLDYCHAPRLPDVLRAGEAVGTIRTGRLTGSGAASENTLVVAGGHDHPVAAAMIQRIDPSARVDSIGTANVVYGESATFPLDRFDEYLAFMVPVQAKRGVACLGVFEFSSSVDALRAQGFDIRVLLALPKLPGEPTFFASADDLKAAAEPRAVLEMAAIAARRMFDHMRWAGVPDTDIYATGGWSRSTSLLELRASVFGRPIRVLSEQEPAVVGAALLAAEGLGKTVDFTTGVTTRTVEPNPRWADVYDENYQAWFNAPGDRNAD
ncbi:FGGY-family carbohydrate kinase [Agrobacterium tumefaciens]|uniref:FGGY-family carbohydrate kinase n=1 Tax=Agrobacterium tumefaciens TaxID=358 RepID=UPI001572821B|nr:FGGY family carbohydrate kinase [Agrobacterium tumefaciens]WCK69504.1 FGGY family carbohydrate kinase [Agrobacterium tumefaciens]